MQTYSLPLVPLNLVVCPEGLIILEIYEERYLDMLRNCIKDNSSFGIVTVLAEGETDAEGNFPFADVGTLMEIVEADIKITCPMVINCLGRHRVKVHSFTQQTDGLVIAQVTNINNDLHSSFPEDLHNTSTILRQLLMSQTNKEVLVQDKISFMKPFRLESASWVSNRLVEMLDLPLLQKQRLMQLDSPVVRLELLNDILETGYQQIV